MDEVVVCAPREAAGDGTGGVDSSVTKWWSMESHAPM